MARQRFVARAQRGGVRDDIEPVRVWLLGGFRLSVGSRTVEQDQWRLKKAVSLLKLLALAPGHRLHREQAMALLWPDSNRKAASNNLRQALYAARRALDTTAGSRYLASEDESVLLCPQGQLWVDVEAFESAAATARSSCDPAVYRAAVDLYAGDLLPEDRYEAWAEERRESLRLRHLSLLVEMAEVREKRGEYEPAIEALRRVLAEEPAHEGAHAGLMRLYALSGERGEAVLQYERLRRVLAREFGAEPSSRVRRLYEEVRARRLPETPPAGRQWEEPAGSPSNNLPTSLTSFVGREHETLEVKRLLSMTRLLTLTGAGGCGKTRLALEPARDLVGTYPGGIWLVELAGLSKPELVPQAIAAALGVPEQAGLSLEDTLADHLRSRSLLLVLDNCEHLVDGVARLAGALLSACPKLKILATSREHVGVPGEVVWTVPPLTLPDADGAPTVEDLMRCEAVRLFVERARSRLPDFELTEKNAAAAASVCRKLDGIPLAIELATARMGALAVEQVAARLEDSLGLLTGGARTADPRQQTMRATLQWSYELLFEPEKKLFGRLSVFAGGWTLEAAEEVCADNGSGQDDILNLLSRLVDKSLVVAEAPPGAGGALRYRMLEPVRQYARVKLEESRETEAVGRRHAAFFLALAEESEPGLWGPEEGMWLERLKAENDNLRAALSWTIERGDAELGLRSAGALRGFWEAQGHLDEGRGWLEQALARDGKASAAARAKALDAAGWLAWEQGDMERAEAAAEEGLKLSAQAEVGDDVATDLLRMLASVAEVRGDYGRAMELYEESLRLCREARDGRGISWSLINLGDVSRHRGDYGRAMEFYEEGLALSRKLGDTAMIPEYLLDLAYVFLLRGDHDRAAPLNEEATALVRGRGNKYRLVLALRNLGWEALLRGDHEGAIASYDESLALCREFGYRIMGSTSVMASANLEGLACAAEARGEAKRAARLFGAAQALREALGYQQTPEERVLRKPYRAASRSQLGEASWEAAFAEGRAMTTEEAVEYALAGEELTAPAAPEKAPLSKQPVDLTRREKEVASLVGRGLSNRQIASELVISEHTVRHHVTSLLKKLNLRSRAQVSSYLRDR